MIEQCLGTVRVWKDLPSHFAIMRHDIDRTPGNALFMARIEADGNKDDVLSQEVWICISP